MWSPVAARRTIRATLVMPTRFAITDKEFGNLQVALFAGFGSFATLVMAILADTWRDKLIAYAGARPCWQRALLVIGTTVSSSTALAALVAVPATFTMLFAGGVGGLVVLHQRRTPRPDQSSLLSGRGAENPLLAAPHRHEAAMRRAGTARDQKRFRDD